jgi:putative acetyltransferase
MQIKVDDLTHPKVQQLLQDHLAGMFEHSPADCVYALDLAALQVPTVTFLTAWDGDELLGCGAIKALSPQQAEIKSMRTATAHLRQGVARNILAQLLIEAQQRGFSHIHLETGSSAAFLPAHRLYAEHGFKPCGPFGDYSENPFSVFMSKAA